MKLLMPDFTSNILSRCRNTPWNDCMNNAVNYNSTHGHNPFLPNLLSQHCISFPWENLQACSYYCSQLSRFLSLCELLFPYLMLNSFHRASKITVQQQYFLYLYYLHDASGKSSPLAGQTSQCSHCIMEEAAAAIFRVLNVILHYKSIYFTDILPLQLCLFGLMKILFNFN